MRYQEFIDFAVDRLGIDDVPKITIANQGLDGTFGHYSQDGITVSAKDRHPVDVMRTLAHELVHYRQDQRGELGARSGETGSEQENQANAWAGVIMRNFGKQQPDIYEDSPESQQLLELSLPKGRWHGMAKQADRAEAADDLTRLVNTAYAGTAMGSFIKTRRDVLSSQWLVMNWDGQPGINAAVFYRTARTMESWQGFKIQGIGHDGQETSRKQVVTKLLELLGRPGWWVETSEALRHVLAKHQAPQFKDPQAIRKLWGDSMVQINADGSYLRRLPSGTNIHETVFGHPIIC